MREASGNLICAAHRVILSGPCRVFSGMYAVYENLGYVGFQWKKSNVHSHPNRQTRVGAMVHPTRRYVTACGMEPRIHRITCAMRPPLKSFPHLPMMSMIQFTPSHNSRLQIFAIRRVLLIRVSLVLQPSHL